MTDDEQILRAILDRVELALPKGFYEGLPLVTRVEYLADHWRHAIEVNKQLQAEVDGYRDAMRVAATQAARWDAYLPHVAKAAGAEEERLKEDER